MRKVSLKRTTKETDIDLELCIDGGEVDVSTGVGFMDHMLTLFAVHGGFGLKLKACGDTHIDDHHTVEDIGILLGKAFYDAAGDKVGICRYGSFILPMDEALVETALDFGGRSYLVFNLPFNAHKSGHFDLQLVEEFFHAFAMNAKITLHVMLRHGRNDHHIAEAAFKGLGRALGQALEIVSDKLPSTKGVLE